MPDMPAIPVEPDPAPTERSLNGALAAAYDDARLRILRALERGEIDVTEAGNRLEALDAGTPDADAAIETNTALTDATNTETTRTPTDV
jgi:hypothetical protein